MLYRTPFKTADELGLSQADYDGLLLVLSHLESGDTINTKNFDMGNWDCCLCGWARRLTDNKAFTPLPPLNAHKLFTPTGSLFYTQGRHASSITPAQAGVVLRHYLLTGEVDWSSDGPKP